MRSLHLALVVLNLVLIFASSVPDSLFTADAEDNTSSLPPVVLEDPRSGNKFDSTLPWTSFSDPSPQSDIWANSQSSCRSQINGKLRVRYAAAANVADESICTLDDNKTPTEVQLFTQPPPANAGKTPTRNGKEGGGTVKSKPPERGYHGELVK